MLEQAVADFLRDVVRSVWALELMLLMLRDPEKTWTAPEITAEMRASLPLVSGILDQYQRAGLVARAGADTWRWAPRNERLATLVAKVAQAQATTPFAVIKAISAEPKGPLRAFADAFRFKGD